MLYPTELRPHFPYFSSLASRERYSFNRYQQVVRFDTVADLHRHLFDRATDRRVDGSLHFHGFENQEPRALFYFLALCYVNSGDRAGNGSTHLSWFAGFGFPPGTRYGLDRFIFDFHLARLAVEFEENGSHAVRSSLAHSQ